MKKSSMIFSIIFLASLIFSPVVAASGIMNKIAAEKKLRVGIAPWTGFIQKDLKTKRYEGIIADDLRNFEKVTGIQIDIVETSWKELVPGLCAGKWDAIMNGLGGTVKRSLAVAFTEPFGYYCEVALIRSNDTVSSFADLDQPKNKIVCIEGTSAHELWKGKFKNAKLEPLPDAVVAIRDVIIGNAKAFMSDLLVNSYRARILPELKLFIPKNTVWFYQAHAVRYSDPDLLEFLNTYIRNMKIRGWYRELGAKWGMPPEWTTGGSK